LHGDRGAVVEAIDGLRRIVLHEGLEAGGIGRVDGDAADAVVALAAEAGVEVGVLMRAVELDLERAAAEGGGAEDELVVRVRRRGRRLRWGRGGGRDRRARRRR